MEAVTPLAALHSHYKEVDARIANAARTPRPPKQKPGHRFGEGFGALAEIRARAEAEAAERRRVVDEEWARLRAQAEATIAPAKRSKVMAAAEASAKEIITEIAAKHGLSYDDIVGPSRIVRVSAARMEAYVAVATAHRPQRSLPWIGRQFGGRDHTTVLSGLRKMGFR